MIAQALYNDAVAITPSDSANLLRQTDALFVGGAGIVVAVLPSDKTVNLTCVAGSVVPIRVKRVNSTSTTATLLVALYTV